MKTSILRKIIISHVALVAVIITVTFISLFNLHKANKIFDDLINKNYEKRDVTLQLLDVLQRREAAIRKYKVVRSDDIAGVVGNLSKEYITVINELQRLADSSDVEFKGFLVKSIEYDSISKENIGKLVANNDDERDLADSLRKQIYSRDGELIRAYLDEIDNIQKRETKKASDIVNNTYRTVGVIAIIGTLLAIVLSIIISRKIIHGINILEESANLVSDGVFDNLPIVKGSDELSKLSEVFVDMAHKLSKLENEYRDASPLTRLPGGISIEMEVQNRIENKEQFAFCMFDLDNFKPFNDRYGYSHGNSVIKWTADIINKSSKKLGSKNDFVGHIGGDDFVLITGTENYQSVCEDIVKEFDNGIGAFYESCDIKNGYIVSQSRSGEILEFPIMGISISVVDTTLTSVKSYLHIGEIVADLKKLAKSKEGSNFVVDRRKDEF